MTVVDNRIDQRAAFLLVFKACHNVVSCSAIAAALAPFRSLRSAAVSTCWSIGAFSTLSPLDAMIFNVSRNW